MAIHLSQIYTTNFGQQSGRIGVILISTTLHIQTAVNAIILGEKKPTPLFLQKHAYSFAGMSYICARSTLPVSRASTVTPAVLLGFL